MRSPKAVWILSTVTLLVGMAFSLPADEPESKKVGELRYSGVIFPMRRVQMQPNMVTGHSARVAKVCFEKGDMVKKDQLLVQLDDREPALVVRRTEAKVEEDRVALDGLLAQKKYYAVELKRLIDLGDAASQKEKDGAQWEFDRAEIYIVQSKAKMESDKLEVEQAKTQLEDYFVRAPFDGVISQKAVEEGQTVENTLRMFEIMEVSSVLVTVNVENEFYHSINDGDKVTATVEVLPGRTFPAVVYKKGPVADPKSKTFPVDVKIENDDNAIKPGWYAEVVFPAKAASKRK